jgi:hypothetical protein
VTISTKRTAETADEDVETERVTATVNAGESIDTGIGAAHAEGKPPPIYLNFPAAGMSLN